MKNTNLISKTRPFLSFHERKGSAASNKHCWYNRKSYTAFHLVPLVFDQAQGLILLFSPTSFLRQGGYVFAPVCLFVFCLSVCLSVSKISQEGMEGF